MVTCSVHSHECSRYCRLSVSLRPLTKYSVTWRQCHSQVIASPASEATESLPSVHHSPSRVTLSPRLTLSRLTLLRKPWVFGAGLSRPVVVTYAYIFFSGRSSLTHIKPSAPTGMLPYHPILTHEVHGFGAGLMPAHHPRVNARLVSCYALFE